MSPANRQQINRSGKCHEKQRGAVLMVMLVILVVGASAILITALSNSTIRIERAKITENTLAQAKESLIGAAVSNTSLSSAGYLNLPDFGFIGSIASPTYIEGQSVPNFTGNTQDYSLIGKVPWNTLDITPSRDVQGGCPWYIVSGRFKIGRASCRERV